MIVLLTLIFSFCLGIPTSFALPTVEATTLTWTPSTDLDVQGYYIYWTPRIPTLECTAHTTYTNTARSQLPDPTAASVDISVFAIGQLHELCFAVTAYNSHDHESGYASRGAGDDYGWTGMIAATEFGVQ